MTHVPAGRLLQILEFVIEMGMGEQCLVLGAWCLVLGAWCLVLSEANSPGFLRTTD